MPSGTGLLAGAGAAAAAGGAAVTETDGAAGVEETEAETDEVAEDAFMRDAASASMFPVFESVESAESALAFLAKAIFSGPVSACTTSTPY